MATEDLIGFSHLALDCSIEPFFAFKGLLLQFLKEIAGGLLINDEVFEIFPADLLAILDVDCVEEGCKLIDIWLWFFFAHFVSIVHVSHVDVFKLCKCDEAWRFFAVPVDVGFSVDPVYFVISYSSLQVIEQSFGNL